MRLPLATLFLLLCLSSYTQDTLRYPPPPLPPPLPLPYDDFAHIAPIQPILRHSACDTIVETYLRKQCENEQIISFLQGNLIYPQAALLQNISGTVVVQYIINEAGYIQENSIEIIRDIGAGCGQEAMRLVKLMQQQKWQWTLFQRRDKPVKVRFALPVKFRL